VIRPFFESSLLCHRSVYSWLSQYVIELWNDPIHIVLLQKLGYLSHPLSLVYAMELGDVDGGYTQLA